MRLVLKHIYADGELAVCTAFLLWQGVPYEVQEEKEVLADNNGKGGVLIYKEGEVIARGAVGLVDYFLQSGRMLQ